MVTGRLCTDRGNDGFAMGTLLVSIFVMSLLLSMALPVWHHAAQREREAELIFRGEQYARAIALWQRQRPGSAPQDLDTLVEERFLRKRYRDPMTSDGKFRVLLQSDLASIGGSETASADPVQETFSATEARNPDSVEEAGSVAGGIVGVVSTSTQASISSYNGRSRYDEWFFISTEDAQLDTPLGQPNINNGITPESNLGAGPAPR
jgi:type II secretory pathway pseudopilin PulG|tara:strand:+ start:85 stop:705 length:621 start_codon:yes stop_codon:yes gene_type:complete